MIEKICDNCEHYQLDNYTLFFDGHCQRGGGYYSMDRDEGCSEFEPRRNMINKG